MRNIQHDQEVSTMFEARGWTVLRIGECEFKKKSRSVLAEKLNTIVNDEQKAYPVTKIGLLLRTRPRQPVIDLTKAGTACLKYFQHFIRYV